MSVTLTEKAASHVEEFLRNVAKASASESVSKPAAAPVWLTH